MFYKKIGYATLLDMLSNFLRPPKGSAPFSPQVDHEKNKICSICTCDTLFERSWGLKYTKINLTEFRQPPEGSVNFNAEWGPRRIKLNLVQYAHVIPCLKALEIWSSNKKGKFSSKKYKRQVSPFCNHLEFLPSTPMDHHLWVTFTLDMWKWTAPNSRIMKLGTSHPQI